MLLIVTVEKMFSNYSEVTALMDSVSDSVPIQQCFIFHFSTFCTGFVLYVRPMVRVWWRLSNQTFPAVHKLARCGEHIQE